MLFVCRNFPDDSGRIELTLRIFMGLLSPLNAANAAATSVSSGPESKGT